MAQSDWRRFIETFSHISRKTGLCPDNQQQLTAALGQILAGTPEGSPTQLEPLYAWLVEGGHDEEILRETFIAFMARGSDLGVNVLPPTEIALMEPAARDSYTARFMERGTGEFAAPVITKERPNPLRSDESKSKVPKGYPKKKKSKGNIGVLVALGVAAIALILAASFMSAPPTVVDVKTRSGRGFPCKTLSGNPPELVCFVPDDEYKELPSEEKLKELTQGTLDDGGARFTSLTVYTLGGKLITRQKK